MDYELIVVGASWGGLHAVGAFLEGLGYRVEWHEYSMQHSLCAEEIRDIGAWLNRVLAKAANSP